MGVQRWTGHEAGVLRQAMRMSQEGFAEYLGVTARMVSMWESRGRTLVPRPHTQAMLDTALKLASTEVAERFERGLEAVCWRSTLVAHQDHGARPDLRVEAGAPSHGRDHHLGDTHHAWEVPTNEADLRGVIELSRRTIGGYAGFAPVTAPPPTAQDIAPLQLRVDRRVDAMELCLRRHLDRAGETLVGYLMMYPLGETATREVLAGKVTNAQQISPLAIAAESEDEHSLYIAMVLGADVSSRSAVMERCIHRVARWSTVHPRRQILAKRSTADGERWLKRYGFVPIAENEGIWLRPTGLRDAALASIN
jgi:transcriptional regulator with XRE-family HTH domain